MNKIIKIVISALLLLSVFSCFRERKKNIDPIQLDIKKYENKLKVDNLRDTIILKNTRHSDSLISFNVKIDSTQINIQTIDYWYNADIQLKEIIHTKDSILISRLFLGNTLIEDQFFLMKSQNRWKLYKYYTVVENNYPNLEKCLKNISSDDNEIDLVNQSMLDGCQVVDDYNNDTIF